MERRYYTIPEAAEQAECTIGDIHHYIQTGQIEAALYSTQRQFFVVMLDQTTGSNIGVGTVYYQGLILPHQGWIRAILENNKIVLSVTASPLELSNLTHYSQDNPFRDNCLPDNIKNWNPERFDMRNQSLMLCPLPRQARTTISAIGDLIDKTLFQFDEYKDKKEAKEFRKDLDGIRYVFNYEKNGNFALNDLRLTKEMLFCLNSDNKLNTENSPNHLDKLPWCDSKQSPSRIDEVLERLVIDHGLKATGQIWKVLINDVANESFVYDRNEAIDQIDDLSLEWLTRSGESKQMKYKTFTNKISDIRGFYITNNLF